MKDLVCLAAPENVVHYWTNYQSNHGALPYNKSFEKKTLEGLGNCEVIPVLGLSGSDRLIITKRYNMVLGTDSLDKMGDVKYWEEHWDLDMGIKFKAGVEYKIAEYMFVNNQA